MPLCHGGGNIRFQFGEAEETVAAVLFPDDGPMVGESVEEGMVVAQQLVVGAEGEVQLPVSGMELLEYLSVELLILRPPFL